MWHDCMEKTLMEQKTRAPLCDTSYFNGRGRLKRIFSDGLYVYSQPNTKYSRNNRTNDIRVLRRSKKAV
ncbi:hypothetical protein [Kingella potus]|uniref:hypothetical protein n=1 Tax=Kingella potus TaxID=265175 RepID=UPI001FD53114|nr:hypothetical protein [Kingella potus]UOP01775.1 hypothetical protein LVJ84_06620 [Kingella potus]